MNKKVIAKTKHITIIKLWGYNPAGTYIKQWFTVIWNPTGGWNGSHDRHTAFNLARDLVKHPETV